MDRLLELIRTRLDDLNALDQEFDDEYLRRHLQQQLDLYGLELPIKRRIDEQLIIVETMISIVTSIKLWADGESYSYKSDAIQMTRGLMSKHYLDTIKVLKEERNKIVGMDGGFA